MWLIVSSVLVMFVTYAILCVDDYTKKDIDIVLMGKEWQTLPLRIMVIAIGIYLIIDIVYGGILIVFFEYLAFYLVIYLYRDNILYLDKSCYICDYIKGRK